MPKESLHEEVIRRYKESQTPETADAVISAFGHLLNCYTELLTTGSCVVNGKLPWFLRRFCKIVNPQRLIYSLSMYSPEDIRQELTLGLLEVARDKEHVVYAFTYKAKQIIRRLTKDAAVKATDYVTDYDGLIDLHSMDEIDVLSYLGLTPQEFLIAQTVLLKEMRMDDARSTYNLVFHTNLGRAAFSTLVEDLKAKLRDIFKS